MKAIFGAGLVLCLHAYSSQSKSSSRSQASGIRHRKPWRCEGRVIVAENGLPGSRSQRPCGFGRVESNALLLNSTESTRPL